MMTFNVPALFTHRIAACIDRSVHLRFKALQRMMNIEEASVGGAHAFVLIISRFFGLAPITFHSIQPKNEDDQHNYIRRIVRQSRVIRIVSLLVVFPIAGISLYGLYKEHNTEKGLSVWMNSATGRMVGSCNVIVVVISSLVAICTARSRIKNIIFVLNVLENIDHGLGTIPNKSEERNKCLAIILILISWSCLLSFDVLVYIVEALSLNTHYVHFIRNFVCFYVLYYVVMMMATHFAFTTHSIHLRLNKINERLESICTSPEVIFDKMETVPIIHNNQINVEVSSSRRFSKGKGTISRLSEYHGLVCMIAKEVDGAFGLPVFVILIGTLLHLIVTPYFLILELNTNRLSRVAVQTLWCVAHASRLILLVEPCHRTKMEANRTNTIIADMIGKANVDRETMKQLNIFSCQLFHRSINFTALGVCNLDRTLIASVATAVTTYLVILIQFQK